MIWTAILIACLASAPRECRSHEMIVTAGIHPASAYVEAQAQASAWIVEHPGFKQRSLTLRPAREI
jgi:hypothetical protein